MTSGSSLEIAEGNSFRNFPESEFLEKNIQLAIILPF